MFALFHIWDTFSKRTLSNNGKAFSHVSCCVINSSFQFEVTTITAPNSESVIIHVLIWISRRMAQPNFSRNVKLTRQFLEIGREILGLDPATCIATQLEKFRHNFKYMPARCAIIFSLTRNHPTIPKGYQPKHLLWTLYFLLTYTTERRLCCVLKADRKTIRKYTWPTITAIACLVPNFVSILGWLSYY